MAETPREPTRPLPAALLRQAEAAGIALGEALGRMSGKSDLFVRMVSALADEAAALPSPLAGAAAARSLHGLRGLAATLGADRLAVLAAQGEHALHADGQLPEDWLASFDSARQQDLAALAALASQLPVDAPAAAAGVAIHSVLLPRVSALIELLLASDMAALDSYAALRPTLLAEQPLQAAALDSALARLDFAEAADRCQAVLRLRVA
jgi:HPt (histidine-containing phosphotransfer) domain-containing protein